MDYDEAYRLSCHHDRIIRSGRMAKWKNQRGKRTLTCLDCGQFWLWNPDHSIFRAGGIHGGTMHAKLKRRRQKMALNEQEWQREWKEKDDRKREKREVAYKKMIAGH